MKSRRKCAVPGCTDETLKKYFFPSSVEIRKIWLERIGNRKLLEIFHSNNLRGYSICGKHFHNLCIGNGRLIRSSLPTLFLPNYDGPSNLETSFYHRGVPRNTEKIPEILKRGTASGVLGEVVVPKVTFGAAVEKSISQKLQSSDDFNGNSNADETLGTVTCKKNLQILKSGAVTPAVADDEVGEVQIPKRTFRAAVKRKRFHELQPAEDHLMMLDIKTEPEDEIESDTPEVIKERKKVKIQIMLNQINKIVENMDEDYSFSLVEKLLKTTVEAQIEYNGKRELCENEN